MRWSLFYAFRQIFPRGKFLSFISLVSVIGVTLGVAVLLVVQTVMNGFGEEIRRNIVATNGDIRIEGSEPIFDWQELVSELAEIPEISGVTPFAQGVVLLQYGQRPTYPVVRGHDPVTGESVVPLSEMLILGDVDDLDDDTVFLSSGLARSLGARIGARIDVYTPLMLEYLKEDEVLLPRELTVAGIFESGWTQIDANTMVVTLRRMQELYGLGRSVHGIAVNLKSGIDPIAFSNELRPRLPSHVRPITWIESNQDLLFVLQLEKTVMFFIVLFITLVASFCIAVSLMMSVLRKTREIGLLAAMGAKTSGIALSFCWQGIFIGISGTTLGIIFAMLTLHYRNPIVKGLAELTGREDILPTFYQFTEIPIAYNPNDFVMIITFALIISLSAGVLPAIKASRLKPATALRHEG